MKNFWFTCRFREPGQLGQRRERYRVRSARQVILATNEHDQMLRWTDPAEQAAGDWDNLMSLEVTVRRAIAHAESILPGTPAPEGKNDRRWAAIIRIGMFAQTQPEAVWQFVRRWGKHAQADLRMAVATCLLEHLLEHHFDLLFPRVQRAALASPRFANTFSHCWLLGQADLPKNAEKMKRLKREIERRGNRKRASARQRKRKKSIDAVDR